jgi:hypothetical protein
VKQSARLKARWWSLPPVSGNGAPHFPSANSSSNRAFAPVETMPSEYSFSDDYDSSSNSYDALSWPSLGRARPQKLATPDVDANGRIAFWLDSLGQRTNNAPVPGSGSGPKTPNHPPQPHSLSQATLPLKPSAAYPPPPRPLGTLPPDRRGFAPPPPPANHTTPSKAKDPTLPPPPPPPPLVVNPSSPSKGKGPTLSPPPPPLVANPTSPSKGKGPALSPPPPPHLPSLVTKPTTPSKEKGHILPSPSNAYMSSPATGPKVSPPVAGFYPPQLSPKLPTEVNPIPPVSNLPSPLLPPDSGSGGNAETANAQTDGHPAGNGHSRRAGHPSSPKSPSFRRNSHSTSATKKSSTKTRRHGWF